MKFIIAAALAGGGTAAFTMPSVGADECAIVSTDIEREDETLIDPEPPAVGVRIIVYCGHEVVNENGISRTDRSLKVIELDVDQATVLVEAADELLDDGDVFLSDGRG
jgi:hypothetical protein